MRNITARLRAAVGVLGILAFASPLAAQAPHRRGEMRQQMRWRQGAAWQMAGWGWQRGYAVGHGWRGYALRPPMARPLVVARYAGSRYGRYPRPWRRAWAGWRYGHR